MQTPNPEINIASGEFPLEEIAPSASNDENDTGDSRAPSAPVSTLIEFPGAGVRNRPAWRKELSERVREIQQRRAREAALETDAVITTSAATAETERPLADASDATGKAVRKSLDANAKQLGLVPPQDAPEVNPIVVAALQRIERARQHSTSSSMLPRSTSGRTAATAAARVAEEQFEPMTEPAAATHLQAVSKPEARAVSEPAQPEVSPTEARQNNIETTLEPVRVPSLVAVPSKPVVKSAPPAEASAKEATPASASAKLLSATETVSTSTPDTKTTSPETSAAATETSAKPLSRRIEGVIDDSWLTRLDEEILPKVVEPKDVYVNRASRTRRFFAGLTDLILMAFLCAPFGAVIELTIGNWRDPRVSGSMAGIVVVLMFLYLTCSTALAGRTPGMKLFSLHTVDATNALVPKTGQCVRRSLIYMLTLAAGGIGILYALLNSEGRTAHDKLSGTMVVKS